MSTRVVQFPQDDNERQKFTLLKEFFHISISDYELLCACDRDSENPWGMRNDQATPGQKKSPQATPGETLSWFTTPRHNPTNWIGWARYSSGQTKPKSKNGGVMWGQNS